MLDQTAVRRPATRMHVFQAVDRLQDSPNHPQAKVSLFECPTCHFSFASADLTTFNGRQMCRNCVSAWFEDDEADNKDKPSASS